MTVSSTPSVKEYVYAGPGDYTFPFLVFEETDLIITHLDSDGVTTELELTTDYTVVINEAPLEGGMLTMINPTESGGTLIIDRVMELSQEDILSVGGDFDVRVVERALDKCIMILQQFQRYIEDTLRDYAWRGTWATGSAYVLRDIVVASDSNIYICIESHTSGTFATDLGNGKWALFTDVSSVIENKEAAETAQAAAEAAQAECESIQDTIADLVATAAAAEASAQGCVDAAEAAVDGINAFTNITSDTTLTEDQCTNTLVTNYGASAGVLNITLPALSSRVKFEIWNESTVSLLQVVPPSGEQFFVHDIGLLEVDNSVLFPLPPSGGEVFTLRRVRLPSSAYRWQIERLHGDWA